MRITESKLRSIIRSVIREARDEWRDRLPGGRSQTWHIRGKGEPLSLADAEAAALKRDKDRSTDDAWKRHGHDGRRGPSEEDYTRALGDKFYNESGISPFRKSEDAYAIARTYLNSPKEEFHIADFANVSDMGLVFLKHYFNINDEDSDVIEKSELEDLCFNPEKLDLDPDEFELYYDR